MLAWSQLGEVLLIFIKNNNCINVVLSSWPSTFTYSILFKLGDIELEMMNLYPNIGILRVIRGQEGGQDHKQKPGSHPQRGHCQRHEKYICIHTTIMKNGVALLKRVYFKKYSLWTLPMCSWEKLCASVNTNQQKTPFSITGTKKNQTCTSSWFSTSEEFSSSDPACSSSSLLHTKGAVSV